MRSLRSRARPLTVGVVVAVVAVGATAGLIAAFDRGQPLRLTADGPAASATAWAPPDVLALWPENPVRGHATDATTIQRLADRGDPQTQWRLDAANVVRRFAGIVLGWRDVTLVELDIDADVDVRAFDITPCPQDAICRLEGPALTVLLRQPATTGPTGVWSVAQVTSPALDVVLPDDLLRPGSEIRFELDVVRQRAVHVGLAASNGCRVTTELAAGLDAGRHALQVPGAVADDGPGCAPIGSGYVFAYVQDDTTVPVGDPLLEAATIEAPYLTLIPIRLAMVNTSPAARRSTPPS